MANPYEDKDPKEITESIVDIKTALRAFQSLSQGKTDAVLRELAKQEKPFNFIANSYDLRNFVGTVNNESQHIFHELISNEKLLEIVKQSKHISGILSTLPVRRKDEFVNFLDVHKLASVTSYWEMLNHNLDQLDRNAFDVNDLSAEELILLNVNSLTLGEVSKKLSPAKMTELIDIIPTETLVAHTYRVKVMSPKDFDAVMKYSSDKKFNDWINGLGGETLLRLVNSSRYKFISTELGLTPERNELFADKLFATLRATVLDKDTDNYDILIQQVGKHISPAAHEAHADLVVRNLAPEEMIKHVFEFKQKLEEQKSHIQSKVKPSKDGAALTAEQISTNHKSEVIDKMIARINNFILKPEINEYKKFVEAVKSDYTPQMASAPKHGLFGRATGKPSGSLKVFMTFSEQADDILKKADAGYDKPRSPSR